ncbi:MULTISPECIES: response regulator [Delftia]|uniref:response regulator n=1 Tax=Delftia TaxID=80865 RepID=UPI001D0C2ADB|nr:MULTISPECIES: HD domain-containing phosphohydrolase [Delftia]MCX7505727.1 HD domain-containing protein [Delftia tsuruhatensis]
MIFIHLVLVKNFYLHIAFRWHIGEAMHRIRQMEARQMNVRERQESFAPQSRLQALMVDCEVEDFSGLGLLLGQAGYDTRMAASAPEALTEFAGGRIDLLICNTRVIDKDGGQWLENLVGQSPDLFVIFLSECSPMAITKGLGRLLGLHRHIVKPWNSEQFLAVIEQLNDQKITRYENIRLEQKNRALTKELAELNATVELTAHEHDDELLEAHRKLKKSFVASIRMFSNLLEWRGGILAGHSRRVADLTRRTASIMQLSEAEQQNAFVAALIHDIAHITLPDGMLSKPVPSLSHEELDKYRNHSSLGEQLLLSIDDAHLVATLVRSHHERFDGAGYPDGLKGKDIPIGARIIAVADFYDDLMVGHLSSKPLTCAEARTLISHSRGAQFDPEVVDAFLQIVIQATPAPDPAPINVPCSELRPGMILAQDFVSREGLVLLTAGRVLTPELIRRMQLRVDLGRKFPIRAVATAV